ncbi:MAG: DNA polymerase III subunit beta [Massiliimalia sp.]|jgi:DNA polymerase-3 subunit beta
MKFSCDKAALSETINNVILAVASKSTMLSLEGILMKCEGAVLTLTGYNLELGIIKSIPVKGEEDGEIVLNASLLSNIVNKMPAGEISFSSDQRLLTIIRCNDAEFTILGLSAEDYPEIPVINNEKELTLPQDVFRNMIGQTLFAVAQTEQTPIYTGSLFDVEPGLLSVVSVDGYRLAMRKEAIENQDTYQFVVPGKTLNEVQKLLAKFNGEQENQVSLRVSNKHIIFEVGGYSVISRLLEGEFLDYRNAIPKESKTKVTANTREFLGSINRASIIINDRAKSPIRCEFSGGVVRLNCETTLGKVQDSFQAEMEGADVKIGFNNKYMSDALKASECDEVLIEMNGPLSPMKVLPLEGDSFLFLVLPVRLKD